MTISQKKLVRLWTRRGLNREGMRGMNEVNTFRLMWVSIVGIIAILILMIAGLCHLNDQAFINGGYTRERVVSQICYETIWVKK